MTAGQTPTGAEGRSSATWVTDASLARATAITS